MPAHTRATPSGQHTLTCTTIELIPQASLAQAHTQPIHPTCITQTLHSIHYMVHEQTQTQAAVTPRHNQNSPVHTVEYIP